VPEAELTLTASLRAAALDARRGVVRLHPEVLAALGLAPGAPVRLTGRRATAGIAALAEPTASRALLYADDLVLGNLGVRDGGQVTVSAAPVVGAARVTLAGPAEVAAVVSPEMLRLALLGKVVTTGDNVSLLPQDVQPDAGARTLVQAARRSLANTVGFAWTSTLLTVTAAEPHTAALVTMDTVVGWRDGQATHAPGEPMAVRPVPVAAVETAAAGAEPVPEIDDLPGLRAQAQELVELFDLGFHHREVLTRLGTTVALGVLVSGPAGSGKSTLVRAVAADVGARVVALWGPELAALANDDAARRLRDAAGRVTADGPAVLLVTDVEALAPREDAGPLATVFRQVVAEVVRAGAAVVATTSRPESVDPALRGPHLLAVQLTVPLPDAALRREQLAVLTRGMPLGDDVRLDALAERTPGFVAADLGALVREAGVRAALRQKEDVATPTVAMADFEAALEVVRPTSMAESMLELARVTLADVGDLAEVKQLLTESVLWPLRLEEGVMAYAPSEPGGKEVPGKDSAPSSGAEDGETPGRLVAQEQPEDPLSERELEVLSILASGKTNSEAARDLFVSVGTVKSHTNNIYRKLGARNRADAINRARSLGLIR
jgi:transitional endoplasmic reticulum ATPase